MLREPRVLIVDDDVALAEVTCEVMGLVGAPAIYRTSITDALEAMARHAGSIAMLFTDINMRSPLSGVDLAVHVAEEWPHVAICVTSGFDHERPKRLPERAVFLAKPWRSPDVIACLRAAGLAD